MTSANPAAASAPTALAPPPLSLLEAARRFAPHLLSLSFPASTLAFLWTGPHPWWWAPFFAIPLFVLHHFDKGTKTELRQPHPDLPAWPFDALLYALAFLQLFIIYSLARMFEHQAIFSVDMAMVFLLVGGSSGFSIITAHELIHRRNEWEIRLGRLLLCTVLYEHFYTEHIRGHHVRVGTPDDPATARFGETYRAFWRRTVPAQFKSAWRLEARRLGDPEMSLFDSRMLHNNILHGILAGWGIALTVYLAFGLTSLVAFLLQAFVAVRLLEAVNYFEHWGLMRRQKRVEPVDSWDTHSWLTFHALTGLSRHADHHAHASRPFQQLRVWDEAPLLPGGYVATVDMVIARNDEFIAAATAELERRQLGPFADGEPEVPRPAPAAAASGLWSQLPMAARIAIFWGSVLLVFTLGGGLEQGMAFWPLLTVNVAIFLAFFLAVRAHMWLESRVENEAISWPAAIVLLVTLGSLAERLIA